MKKKLCILLAIVSCFGTAALSACKDEKQSTEENDYIVNTTPNIGGSDGAYEQEEEAPYITKYSVLFVTGDENVKVPAQTVVSGEKAVEPTAPEREGYTFLGWYTADGALWDFATASVEDHMTLTAYWQKN